MYFVTKNENTDKTECDSVPCSLMQIKTLQEKFTTKTMIVLFDPGSTCYNMKQSVLPNGATPTLHQAERKATTLGVETMSSLSVKAQNITLPEFPRSLKVDKHEFWIHDNENVCYDAIIGRDLLQELKLDVCYSNGTMKMEGRVVLMKQKDKTPTFYIDEEDVEDDAYAVQMKDANQAKVKIGDVIDQQEPQRGTTTTVTIGVIRA